MLRAVFRSSDARSIRTCYAYDPLHRLTQKSYSDGTPTAYFGYDETSYSFGGTGYPLTNTKGRLSHTTTGSNNTVTIHSYDPVGRTLQLWQCMPTKCANGTLFSNSNTYDPAGDLLTSTRPIYAPALNNVATVTYNYGAVQQVTSVTTTYADPTHPATVAQGMAYTPFGALSQLVNGCVGTGCVQRQETYTYNNRLQPVMIQLGQSGNLSANTCLVYNYYSGAQNPTSCAPPSQASSGNNGNAMGMLYQDNTSPALGHTMTYQYDGVNRVTSAVATGAATMNLAYGYDRYGNVNCTGTGLCTAISYDPNTNRITSVGSTSVTYDAAGNQTSDPTTMTAHTYQWDAEGRMVSVDGVAGQACQSTWTACFSYNALGERVEMDTASYPPFNFLYDASGDELGLCVGALNTGASCQWLSWVKLGGRTLAGYSYGYGARFEHPTALGSTATQTDYAGALDVDMTFYPWGQIWNQAGPIHGDIRFAGFRYPEWQFGPLLYPTNTRKYNPSLSHWLSPDPLAGDVTNPQSLNRYAYVRNNPCSLTDPFGLSPSDCSFNITIVDNGVMSPQEASAAQMRLRDLLAKAGVGVNFNQTSPDLTLTPVEGGPPDVFGNTPGSSGTLYVNNIRAEVVPVGGTGSVGFAVGTTAAHELTHTLFGGTLLGTGRGLNHEGGWDAQKLLTPGLNWEDPSKIHQACQERHPNNPTSGSGGAAGGGGGSNTGSNGGQPLEMGPGWSWYMWQWIINNCPGFGCPTPGPA